jgi:predicted nucleic acid-binding protein
MKLVDSCIYIGWMRAGTNPVKQLHTQRRELISCDIVHMEILRGVTDLKIKAYLAEFFSTLPLVPLSPAIMHAATEQAWACDRKGMVLPLTDHIIAACALKVGATIITRDKHFSQIPNLQVATTL